MTSQTTTTVTLTDASFQTDVLDAKLPVLVDVYADWCPPCRQQGPVLEKLAAANQGRAVIGKLDSDRNHDVPSSYGVRSLPTLLLFQDGVVQKRFVGYTPAAELQAALDQLL